MAGKPRHGCSDSREHRTWVDMRQRCYNKNNKEFIRYGARGITVCAEWHFFEAFKAWYDIYFEEGKTLDRIKVDGNYEPNNCQFATLKEQANNRRTNVFVEHNGEILTAKMFIEKYGVVTYRTAQKRASRDGLSWLEAGLTPLKQLKPNSVGYLKRAFRGNLG